MKQDKECLPKESRLLKADDFFNLGGADIVLKVDCEALDPKIKLICGEADADLSGDHLDFSCIDPQFYKIF